MHHGRYGKINMETRKILIFGASGFIGSNLARELQNDGFDVHISIRQESNLWRINTILRDLTIHKIELFERDDLISTLNSVKPEIIINTIGADQRKNPKEVDSIWKDNFSTLISISRAMKTFPETRLIQSGSSFEYGKVSKRQNPINEDEICEPVSEYGISKLYASEYLKYLSSNTNIKSSIVRIFNVYGQYENQGRLIPDIIFKMLNGSIIVLKNPNVSRDFIHINDVIEAYRAIINKSDILENFSIFNVGTGKSSTVIQVADQISDIIRSNSIIDVIPSDDRPENFIPGPIADISKSRKILNWNPVFDLRKGLLSSIEWFQQNKELYRNV